MNEKNKRKSLNNWLQEGVIIFTGSGISFSAPSEIPTSNKINLVIRDAILDLSIISDEIKRKAINVLSRRFSEIKMETFFEVFLRNGFKNILDCLLVIGLSKPNLDHFTIAQLCKLGYVKAIFTLNFDYLQEDALDELKVPYKSILTNEQFDQDFSLHTDKVLPVFHLHNGFVPGKDKNLEHLNAATSKVRSHLPKPKADIFKRYLDKYSIFCAGYSDNDIDTFPIIAADSNKVVWYSHFHEKAEPLCYEILKLKKEKGEDFLHIIRNESKLLEFFFSDTINNSISSRKLRYDELKELASCDTPLSMRSKLNYISRFIQQAIGSSTKANILLADLLDIITEREISFEIIKKVWANKGLSKYEKFSCSRILRHIYERLGKSHKASKYSRLTIKLADENDKLIYMILHAGALNGTWKKAPYRIDAIIAYLLLRIRLAHRMDRFELLSNQDAYNYYYFECGDFLDFIGGYFFFPSVMCLRFITKFFSLSNDRIQKCFNNQLLFTLDKIVFNILRPFLLYIQNTAIAHYEKTIKNPDSAPGFVYLCICRCVEILSFQHRFIEAKKYLKLLNEGLNYFSWTNETYAKGNIYLALYAFYGYQNNSCSYKNLDNYIQNAIKTYGTHFSGLFKSIVFQYRIKNKNIFS